MWVIRDQLANTVFVFTQETSMKTNQQYHHQSAFHPHALGFISLKYVRQPISDHAFNHNLGVIF